MVVLVEVVHFDVFNAVLVETADAKMIESLWPLALINQHVARAVARRKPRNLDACVSLDLSRNVSEIAAVLHRRHHRAVAVEIGAETIELEVRQLIDELYRINNVLIVIEHDPFPEVAHVDHEKNFMRFTLTDSFCRKRLDNCDF